MALKRQCSVCGQVIEVGGNGLLLPHSKSAEVTRRDDPKLAELICPGGMQDWVGTPPLVK